MQFKVQKIEKDTAEGRMLNELFVSPVRESFVEIGDEKFVMPVYFEKEWEKINKFEVRDDDVFLTGHPKTGTTWAVEMVDLIMNDFQVDYAKNVGLKRLYFLDFPLIYDRTKTSTDFAAQTNAIEALDTAQGPRCIRTHLPWFLLPEQIRNGSKTPKVIHCLRNPKDTCISYYHQSRAVNGYVGTFEEFCRLFLSGKVVYGSFFTTAKSYWEQRQRSNVSFVRYSEMKKDLPGVIRTTSEFMGKTPTDEQVNQLVNYLSFDSMKKGIGKEMDFYITHFAKTHNVPGAVHTSFCREGKEGGYKSVMSAELIEKFDTATKQVLLDTGLSFE